MNILKQIWTLILYEQNLNIDDIFEIAGDEFHYLINVLRLKFNDSIAITNGIGTKGHAVIHAIHKKSCEIKISDTSYTAQRAKHIHLLLAQLKPTALEEAIFSASEIGVNSIHVFRSELVGSKQEIKREKLQKISNEAMRISKSAYSAKIFQHKNILDCMILLQTTHKNTYFLFCDENATQNILDIKMNPQFETICPIIGPEASFSSKEREILAKFDNCFPVTLGTHILRAQTAVICASFAALKYV